MSVKKNLKNLVIFQSTFWVFFNSKFLLSDKFDKETQTLCNNKKKIREQIF